MQQSLPDVVRRTRGELTAVLADLDPEAATALESSRSSSTDGPVVVVVGETNRGKSSLVNALLSAQDLSPVAAEVATATYLEFRHGDELSTQACYGDRAPVRFPPEQLPQWVSATDELPDGQLPPRSVVVRAPIPLLERVRLVDTPGVGGLNSMHGQLALEAAQAATALLFVVDGSSPLTRHEVEFLGQAAENVETVLFAVSKIDAHRGYRQIIDENARLLAEYAPRFAGTPMHPVSPRMFFKAAAAPNEQAAALLRERSGVPALQVALQQTVLGRSVMLREANTLRAMTTVFAGVKRELEARERGLSAAEDTLTALRTRRDELTVQRRSSTRGYQVRLRAEIQRARMESAHDVARRIRDVQSWFRGRIDASDRQTLEAMPGEVDAALQINSARISEALAARLHEVAETTLREMFSAEELDLLRAQIVRGRRVPVELRAPDRRPSNAEDKLMISMGVYSGVGVARMATSFAPGVLGLGAAALTPFLLPVTIVVGLGAGWWIARTRRHQAQKQHMKTWLSEAIADARGTLDHLVTEQLITAESQLSLALDDALGQRIEAIEAQISEIDAAVKLETGERNRQLAEISKKLRQVASAEAQLGTLLARIRDLRDRTSGS